jgi:hypothetical protein
MRTMGKSSIGRIAEDLQRPRRKIVVHRVDRVLGFFSSRRNRDSPTPHPQASVLSLAGEEVGGPNSDQETSTMFFILKVLSNENRGGSKLVSIDPFG